MDVAAAGFAASQIASAQRGQQAAFAGIRSQQNQDQNVANLLTQAVSAAKQVAGASPSAPQAPSAPALDNGNGGTTPTASGNTPAGGRGSLVNILA
ncbi:hypothetical protein [Dongia rigui]|uniref:Uncharacterized protein n=1 Tax=Dongia rigui TaxID=940149 RepID=A0ABU5DXH3_9PROT|nr:hypothetical protein [Dongia rigui]MDY0871276.1 hypothetical protein [Dongia rigui]